MALTKVSGSILKDPLNLGEVSIGGTLTYEDVTNIDSVGVITARTGIDVVAGDLVIPDSIIHRGDTNTKIRFPTADTFAVETGGSERLRITSDGKVGIGTDNPLSSLHIFSTSPDILLTDSNQATDTKNWSITAGVSQILRIQAQNDSNSGGGNLFDFYRVTNQINEFRGLNSGNTWFVVDNLNQKVGIGTESPASLLHIHSGSPRITMSDSGTGAHHRINADSGVGNFAFDVDYNSTTSAPSFIVNIKGGEKLRINNNGHLGLNVTPGSWDNTFKALEGGGNSKHGQLFFQANGDWTTALGSNLYFNSGWKYRHTGAANWLEMKEDRTTFYMADSGSADSAITWLERLRIQSAGYITMPYQVAFFAYCSISNHDLDVGDKFQFDTLPSSGNVAVNSNHTTFGGTNVFNTSTNTFTAPVNGLYSFTVTAYYRRTGDPLTPIVPRVNNTQVTNGNNDVMFFANSDIVDGTTLSGTLILQLAANDAVTVHRRSHGAATSCRFYGPHSHFCGHLIG